MTRKVKKSNKARAQFQHDKDQSESRNREKRRSNSAFDKARTPECRKAHRAGEDDENHEPAQHGEFLFVALTGTKPRTGSFL